MRKPLAKMREFFPSGSHTRTAARRWSFSKSMLDVESRYTGYQVAFVAFKDGKASADPVPFLTGLVPDPAGKNVNGRPVGVAVASDGALLVSDDGAGVVSRVSYAP